MSAANRDPEAERAIIQEYQGRKQRLEDTMRKGQEISAEIAEHDAVLKTLEPMDAGRKVRHGNNTWLLHGLLCLYSLLLTQLLPHTQCFRLVGDVLVERTVGEVAPAVKNNREAMVAAIKTLEEQAKLQNDELQAFIKKHNIRMIREGEEDRAPSRLPNIDEDDGEGEETAAKPKAPSGVLV